MESDDNDEMCECSPRPQYPLQSLWDEASMGRDTANDRKCYPKAYRLLVIKLGTPERWTTMLADSHPYEEKLMSLTETIKCRICGKPYKVSGYTVIDQSACPECVRAAETGVERESTPAERTARKHHFGND